MESGVEIQVSRKDNFWYIQLHGDLTRSAESDFFAAFPWLHNQSDIHHCLFDMSSLNYINSAGIALLIRFVREARQRQYTISAFGVSAHYQKVFRIVGLTSYMELFSDEYSASETLRSRTAFGK